jgi:hypothetical protein
MLKATQRMFYFVCSILFYVPSLQSLFRLPDLFRYSVQLSLQRFLDSQLKGRHLGVALWYQLFTFFPKGKGEALGDNLLIYKAGITHKKEREEDCVLMF